MSPARTAIAPVEAVWALSDSLFDERITAANALSRPISLRNPFVFYLGHLPSFSWNTLRKVLSPPPPPAHATFDELFSRGMDPDVEDPAKCHDHPPPPPTWPTWSEVIAYQATVRALVRAATPPPHVLRLIAEHDAMHVETLFYMLAQQARPAASCCPPPEPPLTASEGTPVRDRPRPGIAWLSVPGARVKLGSPTPPAFAWDNEQSPATADVPSFRIAREAVSVAQFATFVRAGGYRRRALWTAEDWDWVQREGLRHPATWVCDGAGTFSVLTGVGPGKNVPPASHEDMQMWPASVSLAEARAYGAWVGADVPSEAQWLLAAHGTAGATAEEGVVDVMTGVPHDVRQGRVASCGAVGMIGNGWELTTTVFDSFEGFQATPEYPEYSADFFDEKHFVLKGASWATHPLLVRPSFRNFYQARYPYVFSKFRLVAPPDEEDADADDEASADIAA